MTKNFKSERERLEKGCGEGFGYDDKYICKKNDLCPICQAKLTQLNECEEMCREEIDECKCWGGSGKDRLINVRELKQNLFGGEDGINC